MNQRMIKLHDGRGKFGEYTIYGTLFQFEGELRKGWKITARTAIGPVEHYWVENGAFHEVRVDLLAPPTGNSFITIGAPVEVSHAEASAVATAMDQWTAEYHDKVLAGP